MKQRITPKNAEVPLRDDEIIVSKTDTKGRITYANRTFMRIAGYGERDLLHQPHNIIRHPDMPRGVFRLLWKTIQDKRECFAYVKNMTSDGSFYWVFANVTPDIDNQGRIRGYHSVRRRPSKEAIASILPLYQEMLRIEQQAGPANAPDASLRFLEQKLSALNTRYERHILTL